MNQKRQVVAFFSDPWAYSRARRDFHARADAGVLPNPVPVKLSDSGCHSLKSVDLMRTPEFKAHMAGIAKIRKALT